MKKLITFSLIITVVVLMSNCSPKIAKTTSKEETKKEDRTNRTVTNPVSSGSVVKDAQSDRSNDQQVAFLSTVSDQRLESGKQLYGTTCNQCHELHSPNKLVADAWVEVMKSMGPKAKLEQGPYLMISAYLVKNAKK